MNRKDAKHLHFPEGLFQKQARKLMWTFSDLEFVTFHLLCVT